MFSNCGTFQGSLQVPGYNAHAYLSNIMASAADIKAGTSHSRFSPFALPWWPAVVRPVFQAPMTVEHRMSHSVILSGLFVMSRNL